MVRDAFASIGTFSLRANSAVNKKFRQQLGSAPSDLLIAV